MECSESSYRIKHTLAKRHLTRRCYNITYAISSFFSEPNHKGTLVGTSHLKTVFLELTRRDSCSASDVKHFCIFVGYQFFEVSEYCNRVTLSGSIIILAQDVEIVPLKMSSHKKIFFIFSLCRSRYPGLPICPIPQHRTSLNGNRKCFLRQCR